MAKMKMDEKFFKGYVKYLEKNMRLGGLDPEDVETLTKAMFQYSADVLGENKGEEEFSLVLPDYIEFKVSQREGDDGEGNFGIGITAGPEMKKRIKDDEKLTDEE